MSYWFSQAITPEFCVTCAKEGSVFCSACRAGWWTSPELTRPGLLIDEHFAVGHYHDKVLQKLLQLWKYHGVTSARDVLLEVVAGTIVDYAPAIPIADAVAFVPLHWRKKNERGFDQAEHLATAVSHALHIPLFPIITRAHYTAQQARVDRALRSSTDFKGVFAPSINIPSTIPNRVLLVDDVWTTGTTISAAAEILLQSGVHQVSALTIAKG